MGVVEMKKRLMDVLKRLKNPKMIGVLAVLVYQVCEKNGIHFPLGQYQSVIDWVSYIIIGVGVYHPFPQIIQAEDTAHAGDK